MYLKAHSKIKDIVRKNKSIERRKKDRKKYIKKIREKTEKRRKVKMLRKSYNILQNRKR